MSVSIETIERLLKRERVARKEAEQLLEAKALELYVANLHLKELTKDLEGRVEERTAELERERNHALDTAEALRVSERRFNDIAEIVGEYFWEMNMDFHFLEVTAQASRVLGYSNAELRGKSLFDIVDKTDQADLRTRLQSHFETGRPFKGIRFRIRRKDGQQRWQSFGGAPQFNDNGKAIRYRGAGLDVTAEEKSKHTMNILGLALENASEGFAMTDGDGNFTYLNSAHVEIYGFEKPEDLIGKHWSVLYSEEEVKRLEPLIGQQIQESGFFSGEAEGKRRDGSVFPEIFSLQALPDGGLLCICRDDTERRRVFTELQTQNSMRSTLLDNIHTGIVFEDSKARSTLLNANFRKLFSIDPKDETLGLLDSLGIFDRIRHKFKNAREFSLAVHSLASNPQQSTGSEFELQNGKFLNLDYLPVQVESEFRGHLWAFRDITVSKQQLQVIEKARIAAESGAQSKSIFLATMSHEIRTPLNGIIGMTRFLTKEPLNERQMDYVRSVDRSANALLEIINDILDFSKIEAGKLDLELVDFSLPELMDGIFDIMRFRTLGKSIGFSLIHDPAAPKRLKGDPSRVRQVILNLAGNAIKFTETGFVAIRVHQINTDDSRVWIEFDIEDSGIGIDKEARARLFEPFSQAESSISRRFGGTGLGLAICKNLVDLMEGTISVESNMGKGSIFRVRLPFETVEPKQEDRPAFEGKAVKAVLTAGDQRIREAIGAILSMEGIGVTEGRTVRESLQVVRSGDAGMPGKGTLWYVIADSLSETDMQELQNAARTENNDIRLVILSKRARDLRKVFPPDTVMLERPILRWELIQQTAEILGLEDCVKESRDSGTSRLERINMEGMSILLAEDNLINQRVARMTLEGLGARVEVAANGYETLGLLEKETFDLILMDIRMPELDGMETCRRIRKMGFDVPIIALTADAMKGDSDRFLSAGMNAYLSKPLEEDRLAAVLAGLFPEREQELVQVETQDAEPETNPLDLAELIRVAGGDKELIRSLLEEFSTQTEALLRSASESMDAGNRAAAASNFHKISGSACSLRATQVGEAALEVERLLRDPNSTEQSIRDMAEEVTTAFNRLSECIQSIDWKSI